MTNQEAINLIKSTIPKGNSAIEIQLRGALQMAISSLGAIEQYKWERDIAVSQLQELGLSLGEKTDEVKKMISTYIELSVPVDESTKLDVEIMTENPNIYVNLKDLVQRFVSTDEYYNHEPWNLKQIISNISILNEVEFAKKEK